MPRRDDDSPAGLLAIEDEYVQHWSDEYGIPYWFHVQTGESTWERPARSTRSGSSAGLLAVEDNWEQHWSDACGLPYWFNVQTRESTWERPARSTPLTLEETRLARAPTAPMPLTPTPSAPAVPTAPMPSTPTPAAPAVPTAPMPSTPTPAAPGGQLPRNWEQHESTWERPARSTRSGSSAGLLAVEDNGEQHWSDAYGLPYWFNVQTRESTWERPGTDSASAGTPMQEAHWARTSHRIQAAKKGLLSRFACRKCNEFYIHTLVDVGGGRFCCKRCDWSNGLEHGWKCEQRPMSWPTAPMSWPTAPVPSTPTPAAPAVPTAPMPSTRTPASPGGQLPRNWEQHWSHACSLPYWFNVETSESTWDRPG